MRFAGVWLLTVHFLSAAPPKTDEGKEAFLRNAELKSFKSSGGGATGTLRATLSDGHATHDAHVQTIDVRASLVKDLLHLESEYTDSYRYNIAAYLLDRQMKLNMIPPTVQREFRGKPASYSWWIDGALTEAQRFLNGKKPPDANAYADQLRRVDLFDYLIDNTDRNKSNLLIDKRWHIWMIDHSRAFRATPNRPLPAGIDPCSSEFRSPVEGLDPGGIREALSTFLAPKQIDALLERRQTFLSACADLQPR